MRGFVRVLLVLTTGGLAALSVSMVRTTPVEMEPGQRAWRRLVGGATPSGRVHRRAVVTLPGIGRSEARQLVLDVDGAASVRYSLQGEKAASARTNLEGELALEVGTAGTPGARVYFGPTEGSPPLIVERISLPASPDPSWWPAGLAFLVAALASGIAARVGGQRLSVALGLTTAGLVAILATPYLVWLTLPARALVPLGVLASGVLSGLTGNRRLYSSLLLIVAAAILGAWIRWTFLPSAGSWDTEYWKAWMTRAVSHGVTGVYGDADATPEGGFWDALRGREPLWQAEYHGRSFVVDYPPLAMALWRWSWLSVTTLAPGLDLAEAENIAVKLPSVVGDVLAVVLLLFIFRQEWKRGIVLAALYWVLPLSWLSSAVLGFLDGAYVPFAVAALVAAGGRRPGLSGALLALAAMIKPQALIVVPAAAVALHKTRSSVSRAASIGIGVVALALVPFAVAGTLDEAVTHVFRILFQERLSAGFANPWWVIGHLFTADGSGARVSYARLDVVPLPAGPVGLLLFVGATVWILWRHRGVCGARAACLAGGGIFFAYSMLAVGVHHNHPHAMFLAFAGTGFVSRRMGFLVAALSLTYVLGMLAMSGLGRFYGLRYVALEPLATWVASFRMMPGWDVTLLLALANTILFVFFLVASRQSEGFRP